MYAVTGVCVQRYEQWGDVSFLAKQKICDADAFWIKIRLMLMLYGKSGQVDQNFCLGDTELKMLFSYPSRDIRETGRNA